MLSMMNKIKLFSWLKLWHPSKNSASGDSNSSTQSSNQGEHPLRHAVGKNGKRDWMRNWNLLHIDKRSCAQTKDVYTVNEQQQQQQQGRCRSQLESASDHLAQPAGVMADHAAHISIRSSSLDLDEKGKESHSVIILLGQTHHHEGIAVMESLKASTMDDITKREATVLDVAAATTPGLDMPLQQKCGLKNKVLPLTTPENRVIIDDATCTPATNPGDSTGASITNDVNKGSEDVPFSLKRIVTRPDTIRRTGSLCLKKLHSAKVSFSDSPKSPRDIPWRKLLSYSRSSSPRSPSCFSQQGETWSREPRGSAHHQKGSFSTMGSPWNSQAGGTRRGRGHSHRRSSFKTTDNQGQWITTDSDFVVLEL